MNDVLTAFALSAVCLLISIACNVYDEYYSSRDEEYAGPSVLDLAAYQRRIVAHHAFVHAAVITAELEIDRRLSAAPLPRRMPLKSFTTKDRSAPADD